VPNFTKEELEDLKTWSKDPKGGPFWATIKQMFADGITDLRAEGRNGDAVKTMAFVAHTDTLEEILDLPSLIIQNNAEGKDAKI
jgi:hypothetical protein